MEVDGLTLYRGRDYVVNNNIVIHQPFLGEICDYGEKGYFGMIHTLCSVGADLKWQLDDIGLDYTKIPDYDLFIDFLAPSFSKDKTQILFGNVLDFSQAKKLYSTKLKDNVLIQVLEDGSHIQIDRYVYSSIVSVLRAMHRLKRNDKLPGNEATRKILIEEAREKYEEEKDKPWKPYLLPLVSAMVNTEGFKHDEVSVFDMKIYPFMDSVSRIGKIKKSELLLQSGYSGFGIDLKKINNEELNWLGELD